MGVHTARTLNRNGATAVFGRAGTNANCTERAFYIHQREVVYVIRHSKSKQYTGHEFNVARFLPTSAGRILFLYLVYIRPFAELLCRERQGIDIQPGPGNQLLFWSHLQGQGWLTARFHRLLTTATRKVWGQPINPRHYRQLSIGITEKHVRGAGLPVDLHRDTGAGANPDVVFAWQSGHRPYQRAQGYGLDGAFPTGLQPALLQAYARASHAWHDFLHLGNISTAHASTSACILPPVMDRSIQLGQAEQTHHNKRLLDVTAKPPPAKRQCYPEPCHQEELLQAASLNGWPPFLRMLPEYRVVLCTMHGGCYTRRNLSRHLLQGHHLMSNHRHQILANLCLEGLALAATPADVVHPSDGSPEIRGLPSIFGFVCHIEGCLYRTSSQDMARQHYNQQHHWKVQVSGQMPWRRAFLQTLFRQLQEVKYFIVMKDRPEDKASDTKASDETQIANFI